jgi:hypothetical protein
VSEMVVIADCDECTVGEGLELTLQGRGLIPYPATPPPTSRPETDRRGPHA